MRASLWLTSAAAFGLALGGGSLALRSGQAPPEVNRATRQSPADPLLAGYRRSAADLAAHYWNDDPREPHIRPTQGDGGPSNGLVVDSSPVPTIWQMAQYANLLYQDWKLLGDADAAAKLRANWAYVKRVSGPYLAGDGKADRSINISDDAAWKANYLAQVHEVTRDPAALAALLEMIPATMARFAQPGVPHRAFGRSPGGRPLFTGAHGMLYAAANEAEPRRTYGLISSVIEAMMANAALYAFEQSGDIDYRDYAVATWAWIRRDLRTAKANAADAATGLYLCDLELDPAKGAPAPRNLFWGKPIRGLSAEYSGGTLAMAVLSARLYRLTDDPRYLAEARSIVAAFPRPDAFGRVRAGRTLFVNERDPWTDGYWYPAAVAEVLSLPGVDPSGAFAAALENTAAAIARQRTADGYYGADWSGPELNFTDKTRLWSETARLANGGRGGGQASPEQIMTSASSASVMLAAVALKRGR